MMKPRPAMKKRNIAPRRRLTFLSEPLNSFQINTPQIAAIIGADLFKSLFLINVWDFDLVFGNCNYLNAHEAVSTGPEGWYIRNHTQEGINTGWYYHMFKAPLVCSPSKGETDKHLSVTIVDN